MYHSKSVEDVSIHLSFTLIYPLVFIHVSHRARHLQTKHALVCTKCTRPTHPGTRVSLYISTYSLRSQANLLLANARDTFRPLVPIGTNLCAGLLAGDLEKFRRRISPRNDIPPSREWHVERTDQPDTPVRYAYSCVVWTLFRYDYHNSLQKEYTSPPHQKRCLQRIGRVIDRSRLDSRYVVEHHGRSQHHDR